MKKRVVCAGTFDYLHPGHLDFLRQAKSFGDELVVIVARDETVRRIKGFLPTHPDVERKRGIEASGIPDMVVLGNTEGDIFDILTELKPEVLALGYDQRVSEEAISARFPALRVVRLAPYMPEKYKSSLFRARE
jgi:FAD synthetase